MTATRASWSLRPANESDMPFCFALHRRTLRDHVIATWGRWDDDDQWQRFMAGFVASRSRILSVGGADVGLLVVDKDTDPLRLLSIAILPEHQGQGLGTAVIRHVIAEAGDRAVWLQVLKVNPAIALYRRLGFRTVEETDTHFRMIRPT